MTERRVEFAQKALVILQEEAGLVLHDEPAPDGADERLYRDPIRYQFERSITDEERNSGVEFRFIGGLGFGGKFHLHAGHFRFPYEPTRGYDYRCYVDCYPEHRTPERDAMIKKTNERLTALADEYVEAFA